MPGTVGLLRGTVWQLAAFSDMKLATYKDGSRDGQLLVVSRDLRLAHYATDIAHTLQQALDDWNFIAPQLQDLYLALNQGRARHPFAFEPVRCMAPLPRAFQWLIADADPSGRPGGLPALRQGSGDAFAGPVDELVVHDESMGVDSTPGLAVIVGDLPARSSPEQALESIRLLLLSNDWCLRALDSGPGSGVQARPGTAFGPVAVTLDELGGAWRRGRLDASVELKVNDRDPGRCEAGTVTWHFGQLLAHACRTRALGAGSVLGTGLRHAGGGEHAWPDPCAGNLGSTAQSRVAGPGQEATPLLCWGDRVRIEARGRDGHSLFGPIEQILSAGD